MDKTADTKPLEEGASLVFDCPTLEPGTRVGRYIVLDWVGSGGMGVVYAAFDPQLDRRVCLKLMRYASTS